MMTTFFLISAKCINFEASSLDLELQVSSLGFGVFDEISFSVSSPNFNQVSVSKVAVSTTSLPIMQQCFHPSAKYLLYRYIRPSFAGRSFCVNAGET